MPNGYSGSKEEWERMQAPFLEIDEALAQFASERNMTVIKNYHNWPRREINWTSNGIQRSLSILLADDEQMTFHVAVVAFTDARGSRYAKDAWLKKGASWVEVRDNLQQLLEEGVTLLESWSENDLEPPEQTGAPQQTRRAPSMFKFENRKVVDSGSCECCGDVSRLASGMARFDDEPYAAYQVHWTANQVKLHGAEFYLILGKWGDGTTAADRFAVALHFSNEPEKVGFEIVDADKTPMASHPLVGRALSRARVIESPIVQQVFGLVDAIWLEDENIAEVTHSIQATFN